MGAQIFGFFVTIGIFSSSVFAIADCKDELFKASELTANTLPPPPPKWDLPQLLDQRSELHASLEDAGSLKPRKRARGYDAIMEQFEQALEKHDAHEAIEIFFVTLEFIQQKRPKRDTLTRIRIAIQAESNGFYMMDGGIPLNAKAWEKYLPFQMTRRLISHRQIAKDSGRNLSDATLILWALDHAKSIDYPSFRGQPFGEAYGHVYP